MKPRNINILEQHVEKVVLVLGVAVALFVVYRYVIGEPYAVKLRTSQLVAPKDVMDHVMRPVGVLKRDLDSLEHKFPKIRVPDYTASFRKRWATAVTPADELPTLELTHWYAWPGLDPEMLGPVEAGGVPIFAMPDAPPPPKQLQSVGGFAVLAYLDGADPAVARVVAAFDRLIGGRTPRDFRYVSVAGVYDMGEWVRALRGAARANRVPEEWIRASLMLTDVVLERRTLDPVTGQWGPAEQIPSLPRLGELGLLRRPPEKWSRPEADRAVRFIQREQDRIGKPEFAPIVGAWDPPRPAEPDQPLDDDAAGADRLGVAARQRTVWAHDVTVRPGQTYQYRLKVRLLNPLFQRNRLAPEQREAEFHRLDIVSLPSPWSDRVTIDRQLYFYVVGAQPALEQATVEVYRIFNGQWRRREFSVQPGDAIGDFVSMAAGEGDPLAVDMRVGSILVDLDFGVPSRDGPGATTTRMIFLNSSSGSLASRTVEADGDDEHRVRLHEQAVDAPILAEARR